MRKHFIATVLAISLVAPLYARQHSVTINFSQPAQPTGETVASTTVAKDGTALATIAPTASPFVDTAVNAGETHVYALANVDTKGISSVTASISATIPAAQPPPPVLPVVGNRISTNSNANIRKTATTGTTYGTLLGIEPKGSLGTIVAGPSGSLPGVIVQGTTAQWMQVKFDVCAGDGAALVTANCTGWMGNDNMTIVTTPPPPPPPIAAIECTGLTCIITTQNIPSGTGFNGTLAIDGVSTTFKGNVP